VRLDDYSESLHFISIFFHKLTTVDNGFAGVHKLAATKNQGALDRLARRLLWGNSLFWFGIGFVSIPALGIIIYAVTLKPMLGQPRFFILACFLVVITSNCIQATYISVSQAFLSGRLVSGPPNSDQTADSAFIVPDDDSDDTPTLILVQTPLEEIQFVFSSTHFTMSTAITASPAERHTVLRL
jgi:hypothetical protein